MVGPLNVLAAGGQEPLPTEPYDHWMSPAGQPVAEFHRTHGGYLVRFPGQADFRISLGSLEVDCTPVPEAASSVPATLFANAIQPMLANHTGGVNLHGSAVAIEGKAVAFVGPSGRGKTTLAGAFAKAGHPFLTEDVIQIEHTGGGFLLVPQAPHLRLHADSAAFLLECDEEMLCESDSKTVIEASEHLAFGAQSLPLRAVVILGPGDRPEPMLRPISRLEGIGQLLRQSFVLDVEDRAGLAAHFRRLSNLAKRVPCFDLDYRRDFAQLPEVIALVVNRLNGSAD